MTQSTGTQSLTSDTDGDMLDYVALVILALTASLVLAYFGLDSVTDGFAVMVDQVRIVWAFIAGTARTLIGMVV